MGAHSGPPDGGVMTLVNWHRRCGEEPEGVKILPEGHLLPFLRVAPEGSVFLLPDVGFFVVSDSYPTLRAVNPLNASGVSIKS